MIVSNKHLPFQPRTPKSNYPAPESHQRISICEVCTSFSVSEATTRRDLESLVAEGKIQRVQGGAIFYMAHDARGTLHGWYCTICKDRI